MPRVERPRDGVATGVARSAAGLAHLRLSPADLAALARQGFVTAERRGRRTYYKLRFRRGGRQQVRYLGSDPARAAAVERALDQLQQARRHELELPRLTAAARRTMRESKQTLAPLLEAEGLRFHGYAIRRPRRERSVELQIDSRARATRHRAKLGPEPGSRENGWKELRGQPEHQ